MTTYILSGARTATGPFLGSLSSVPAPQLGATAMKGALEKAGIAPSEVNEVFMGNVLSAGIGQAPARQAALAAGLPNSVPCTTINKVCGSAMQALISGAQAINAGDAKLVIAGGMENMSLAPHLLMNSRGGFKFGPTELKDTMQWDGLTDPYTSRAMGNCAEEAVAKYNFTREEQDAYAINSFKKAQAAHNEGVFKTEIVPVTIKGKKGDTVIAQDEGIFAAQFDKIPGLRPAFDKNGTITAANASTLNDGASALVLAGEQYKHLAKFKILAYAGHAHEPTFFTTAPIFAMKKCLEKAKLETKDIGVFEINEAFAMVTMAAIRDLQLDEKKVNIFGGAVALGHPIGSSGTRIVVTLMNAMERTKSRYGMASLCIGGGEALAVIIEKI